MLRQILEDCEKSFAEVVLMLSNEATSAEVFTEFKDLKFHENIVTFMAEDGTHLHLYMDRVKKAQFIQKDNAEGQPSYSLWLLDGDDQPLLRVYLRKSEIEETNQPRHDAFLGLMKKYGETVTMAG